MPGIETDNIKPASTQCVHQPWRYRSGLRPHTSMFFDHPLELLWISRALAAPKPSSGLVNNADRGQLLRNMQADKSGHRAVAHMRTAKHHRSDRGTMGASRRCRRSRPHRTRAGVSRPGTGSDRPNLRPTGHLCALSKGTELRGQQSIRIVCLSPPGIERAVSPAMQEASRPALVRRYAVKPGYIPEK